MVPLWKSLRIQTTMRSFADLLSSCLEVRQMSHLMTLTTIAKTTICTGKTITLVFLPTSSTPRSLKSMATSLRFFLIPILVRHGRFMIIEPFLRL